MSFNEGFHSTVTKTGPLATIGLSNKNVLPANVVSISSVVETILAKKLFLSGPLAFGSVTPLVFLI